MYTALELGLDYTDFQDWDKYMSDDFISQDDNYEHDYLNDDKYELPFQVTHIILFFSSCLTLSYLRHHFYLTTLIQQHMMKKVTYTIIDINGYHRIQNISIIKAIIIGITNVINGEEYHLYQSDYEIILPFLN